MPASARATRGPDGSQFLIDVRERPRGRVLAQLFEDTQGVLTFLIAQCSCARSILGDRLAHDVALGLAEACRDFRMSSADFDVATIARSSRLGEGP